MKYILAIALGFASLLNSHAAIVVPGANGTDGALNIIANTEIDLSLAPTAQWDSDNTANAGKGVYDASKWAVVFKYSSVTIAAGATVTFKNHPSRAPVVWLVSGNVTIAGTVSLDGQPGSSAIAPRLSEPGPGGSRGGASLFSDSVRPGAGFGVGGGPVAGHASYGTVGGASVPVYGNPSLIPLMGGSGGGGNNSGVSGNTADNRAGGAGGGAFLIACAGTVDLTGGVRANGGNASMYSVYTLGSLTGPENTGAGSGGGIRIVAQSLTGSGSISAAGGAISTRGPSASGRVRLERVVNTNTIVVAPAPSVVDLPVDSTILLWPPSGAPEVKIVSLGAVDVPADPRAGFGTIGADVAIPSAVSTNAVIETKNVEQASQVKVRITPRDSGNYTEVAATYSSTVSTSPLVIRWVATLPTNLGHSAVQVRVVRP